MGPMTYTTVLVLAVVVATPVAVWSLMPRRPLSRLRGVVARRRGGEARLLSAITRYGADGWRAQDASTLWYRGVDR